MSYTRTVCIYTACQNTNNTFTPYTTSREDHLNGLEVQVSALNVGNLWFKFWLSHTSDLRRPNPQTINIYYAHKTSWQSFFFPNQPSQTLGYFLPFYNRMMAQFPHNPVTLNNGWGYSSLHQFRGGFHCTKFERNWFINIWTQPTIIMAFLQKITYIRFSPLKLNSEQSDICIFFNKLTNNNQ